MQNQNLEDILVETFDNLYRKILNKKLANSKRKELPDSKKGKMPENKHIKPLNCKLPLFPQPRS